MSSLRDRIGYAYGVKDAVLDELGAMGAQAQMLRGGEKMMLTLGAGTIASLGSVQLLGARADLKVVVSSPNTPNLYGLVAVQPAGAAESDLTYTLTRFASDLHTPAELHAALYPGKPATIKPDIETRSARELPWRTTFTTMPGPGIVAVNHYGVEFVDIIAMPETEAPTELPVPEELWCPPIDSQRV
jgi:hypothetical protein